MDLVEEGVTWFSSQGMETVKIPLKVKSSAQADYFGIKLSGTVNPENTGESPVPSFKITLDNKSGLALCGSGSEAVLLSYHVKDVNGAILAEGERINLPCNLPSGETGDLEFIPQSTALQVPGSYAIEVDLVREGVSWFKDLGSQPVQISVTIT